MTNWLGVSRQPTNRPVLFQTGSWEQQRHCLVSSASSTRCLPASSQQPCLMVCATPRWTAVLISACVTHLLLVTLRRGPVWELSVTGANVFPIPPFLFTNRAHARKQASMVRMEWEVKRPCETPRAPVQVLPLAIYPQSLLLSMMCRQYTAKALY